MFQIDPVAHFLGQVGPFLCKLHHVAAASGIVIRHANFFANIFLCDTQGFFNAKLDRQSVRVPAGFAVHLEAFHRLVTAENILDRAGDDVVDTRHTVGGRRTLVKDERRMSLTDFKTLVENVAVLPLLQHFFIHVREVELGIFGKFLTHISVFSLFFF